SRRCRHRAAAHPAPLPSSLRRRPPRPTLFPYTTLFRSPPKGSSATLSTCETTLRCSTSIGANPHSPDRRQSPRSGASETSHLPIDRKSTRLNSSHVSISYAVFCLKKKSPTCTTDALPRR